MIKAFAEIIKYNIKMFPRTFELSRMYLKRKNTTSDLGWFWSLFKPLMYMVMFYVAISTGFRGAKDIDGIQCSYFVWLISGMSAWFYISDLINTGPVCFRNNKPLLLKAGYPIPTIPLIPVLTNLYIHLLMLFTILVIAVVAGGKPTIYWIQIPLVTLLIVLFNYLWSFMIGMLTVVSADIFDFIKAIRPAFFWLSGILFNSRQRGDAIFRYNPITFLVEGYRSAIAYDEWFWTRPGITKHFAIVIMTMLVITVVLYKRLRKSLPDIV